MKPRRLRMFHVTDHALVRWLERVCGFPMEQYRAQLAETLRPIAESGCTTYDRL